MIKNLFAIRFGLRRAFFYGRNPANLYGRRISFIGLRICFIGVSKNRTCQLLLPCIN